MIHLSLRSLRPSLLALCAALLVPGPQSVSAASFTLAPGSPTLGLGFAPSDIFVTPGPVGGPPVLVIPAGTLGLGPLDNIDAMAWGPQVPVPLVNFSVDPLAVGAAGSAVAGESAVGQAAGDIYFSAGGGGNVLAVNQDLSGLLPAVGPGVPVAPPLDVIDSLEANPPGLLSPATPLIFSLDPFSALFAAFPGTGPGDLFITAPGGAPAPFIPFGALGLVPGDDIDALIFDPAGIAPPIISLAPASPSLGLFGLSPGDLVLAVPGLPLFGPGGALGLAFTDNLDAATVVPLPAPLWLLASALAVLGLRRRNFG